MDISNSVRDRLRGSRLLVTGCTGFVGKVLIEKILRCYGDVKVVYLLVRTGNGMQAEERVQKEIVESQIFEQFKKVRGSGNEERGKECLQELCDRVLRPIKGDVTLPMLGISQNDMDMLTREGVDIMIHCAASVDFDNPLQEAIQLNTVGGLGALDVAKRLNVHAHVHVSTAYVNANKKSGELIAEKIYPLDFDAAEVVKKSKKMASTGSLGLSRLQMQVQGDFPNTYTLTKAMAEVLIEQNRGDVPLHIVRPSIVGAAWREPCPGWVDVVSASSAVFMAMGLGVLTLLPGNPRGVAAIVPVDMLVNHLLIAAADIYGRRGKMEVSHCCSSTYNPCRWRVVIKSVVQTLNKRGRPDIKLTPGPVNFRMIQNPQQYSLEWAMRYMLPTSVFGKFANVTGVKKYMRMASQLELLQERSTYIADLFSPFTSTNYIFDCSTMKRWEGTNTTGEQLSVDALNIVWGRYFENYVYGLNRFILHEDLVPISESSVSHNEMSLTVGRLLQWDPDHHKISFPGIMSDISWAYTSSRAPGYSKSGILGRLMGITGWKEGLVHEARHVPRSVKRKTLKLREIVLKTKQVRNAIQAEAAQKKKPRAEVKDRAVELFDEIASTLVDTPPRVFGWVLRKIWRKLYEGIRIHEEGLEKLREVMTSAKHPVVLVPTHRSYVDFLMLSYVFFAFNLPVPFIAASTDFLQMQGVSKVLRESGAFFLRRQGAFQNDPLYAAVFTQYFQQLLIDRQVVEYYVEGTRSRSGKALEPKLGITRLCVEPVIDGRVDDVIFVPVSIDYEKALEATVYSEEMLGTSKPRETTENLIKSIFLLGKKFGHVSVQFAEHISVKQFLAEKYASESLVQTAPRALGFRLIDAMNRASICMPIHLVSTLLLMYKHGITLEQLVPSVEWLRTEILYRGGYVACSEGEHRVDLVKRAISLLGPVIQERQSPRVLEVAVNSSPKDYLNMVVLGYYRNKLVHWFAKESLWACCLYSHWVRSTAKETSDDWSGRSLLGTGATLLPISSSLAKVDTITADLDAIQDDVLFLKLLLAKEFVGVNSETPLAELDNSNVFHVEQGQKRLSVSKNNDAERLFSLLCSISWPFVDSYFIAASALIGLLPDARVQIDALLQRMSVLAENLYHDRLISYYESCSAGTLRNALDTFVQWGIVELEQNESRKIIGKTQKKEVFVRAKGKYRDRSHLQSFINRIESLRRPLVLSQKANFVTRSVADIPMLARI